MKNNFKIAEAGTVVPSAVLKLYNVPWNNFYHDTVIFKNKAEQAAYHNILYYDSTSKYTFSQMRKFRIGENILIKGEIEDIQKCNYLSYNSNGFTYYAFIRFVSWINENLISISYDIDVLQTYMFNCLVDESTGKSKIPECLVEREHVSNDSYFANLESENLQVNGTYCVKRLNIFEYFNNPIGNISPSNDNKTAWVYLVFAKNKNLDKPLSDTTYYSPVEDIGYIKSAIATYIVTADSLDFFIAQIYENKRDINSIIAICPIPRDFFEVDSATNKLKLKDFKNALSLSFTLPTMLKTGNISVKNKKCYNSEFLKMTILNTSNGNSEININDLQRAGNQQGNLFVNLKVYLSPSPYGAFVITDTDIDSWISENTFTNSGTLITSSQLPAIPIISDAYENWIRTRQNAVNLSLISSATQTILSGMGALAMGATGNVVGGAALTLSAFQGVTGLATNALSKRIEESTAKTASNNIICVSSNGFDIYNCNFPIIIITVPNKEDMKRIDDYFQAFGYKINAIKTPNIFTREKWNFLKTNNSKVIGDCPRDYSRRIDEILNAGIRFHHGEFHEIIDSSVDNNII